MFGQIGWFPSVFLGEFLLHEQMVIKYYYIEIGEIYIYISDLLALGHILTLSGELQRRFTFSVGMLASLSAVQ